VAGFFIAWRCLVALFTYLKRETRAAAGPLSWPLPAADPIVLKV
jgi:hypothetical protein